MGEKKTRSFMNVIVRCLTNKGCEAISMRNGKAKDIMTSPAHTVAETTPNERHDQKSSGHRFT
ncbi:MAG: CBS domain-containing protein [bacterium]|nr:CBS domain-containing protein [bacterium]